MHVPAEWLPQAVQKFTVVIEHDQYDTLWCHAELARDWESRGESYVLKMCNCDDDSRIVAMFPGHIQSVAGYAVWFQ